MNDPVPSPRNAVSRGRPQAASRELLQDAAFELFLEKGYAGTTVGDITQRAGVSRNTFFNYFPAKSDVFWVDLDEALDRLVRALRDAPAELEGMAAVRDAIVAFGHGFGAARVPFALTQHELIGSVHELQASALGRFTRQAAAIREFLVRRGAGSLHAQAAAYAAVAATVAAGQEWAAAGTTRGGVERYLLAALDPVVAGFGPVGGAPAGVPGARA